MYLILPANASHDRYPDNKNHNYKIHLPRRLRLDGDAWEIALSSISFNRNWYNVKDAYVRVEDTQTNQTTMLRIKDGTYKSVGQLIKEINDKLKENGLNEKVVAHRRADKLYVIFVNNTNYLIFVRFSSDLAHIFGFSPDKDYVRCSRYVNYIESKALPDVQAGYHSIYVYCSLCANRFVGDSLVPCLYNVPVRPNSDPSTTIVHHVAQPPMYVPAVNTDTDEIEIDIRRGDGEPILFRGGCVIVTVHLRKKKQ